MWCVAKLDEDYIAKMESLLALYEKPYRSAEPVVCLDEKPVCLHADVRPSRPARPGHLAKRDNEYQRRGTANVFAVVEPKAGRHLNRIRRTNHTLYSLRVWCLSGGMSEEQVMGAPRRRSLGEADRLAAEFEASGLSRREFCRRRGVNVSTLDAYRKRVRQTRSESAARLVAVEVSGAGPAASGLAVVLPRGRRIEVERGFDATTLAQLLSLFERA